MGIKRKSKRVVINGSNFIGMVERNKKSFARIDIDSFPKIKEKLGKIESFVKEKYGLIDEEIWDMYSGKDYIGTEYIFYKTNLQGQIYIVFDEGLDSCYYVFKTMISEGGNRFPFGSAYNQFCKNIVNLSTSLGLKMVRSSIIRKNDLRWPNIPGFPTDPYVEPVFIEKGGGIDLESFVGFMKKLDKIADEFPLYYIDIELINIDECND